ncbi:52 kDa repressor of the inhibitor of the protein kinase-like [Oopsacas minuta]|uniref:52 kDa repressor of the inhibitor of the protein kinase-like n=1 Tax=Oopsacas minuta TaxID=111878 RepID=A0AAV7JRY6_9METZ|nr:52 kDa repressor of the inhibitor of the protein kinase-like [Oopsacas minuta]
MGVLKCEAGTTGEASANMILTQLEPQLLRGQTYDAAGAMAGQTKGVAARICAKYPKALYSHCALSNAAASEKQFALEKWIDDILQGKKRHKLKEMCRTRWIERHEAFEIFLDLFLPTFCCLEEMAHAKDVAWNRETRHDAQSFLLAISQFTFIVALVFTQKVFAFTNELSVKLQGRYVAVVYAHQQIQCVKDTLKRTRFRVDNFHEIVYKEALLLASNVDVDESVPRLASRQQHRQNIPSDNTRDYYKRTLTIQMLDYHVTELDSRFDDASSVNLNEFMDLLPFKTGCF